MSYAQLMKDLLQPLNIYDWQDSFQWAELRSAGAALDFCEEELLHIEREMNLMTAEDFGLSNIYSLLTRKPVVQSGGSMREALAALLRIGDRSFTLKAIQDNLLGCGVLATVLETDTPARVQISFPEVAGMPDNFEEIRNIIEDIIPAHVEIDFVFWYLTWRMLEARLKSWREIETRKLSWKGLEGFMG